MLEEYIYILIYFFVSIVLSLLIVMLSMLLVYRPGEIEKLSAYECGFHPFQDTRSKFDVRFYLVAILFIIFDLEIVFLFPWCVIINKNVIGFMGFWVMLLFLILLVIGFLYEWKKGGLDWE